LTEPLSALGGQDSPVDKPIPAGHRPHTLRADNGSVNPLSVMTFGGDWTPTAKLVVSARYGYFFNNVQDRCKAGGTRYSYGNTVNASTVDLAGNPFPASAFNTSGFANIPSNLATLFDAYKRKSFNSDVSYFCTPAVRIRSRPGLLPAAGK